MGDHHDYYDDLDLLAGSVSAPPMPADWQDWAAG